MASLQAIRDAIKATLEGNLADVTAYDTVPDASNLPAVIPIPDEADFAVTMGRGTDTWEFNLYVLVSEGEMGLAQDALDDYVSGAGEASIRAVIFANRTLGLSDVDAHVSAMTDYNAKFTNSELPHVGAVLRLIVHTSGKV